MSRGSDWSDSSDRPLLDLIRRKGPLTVADMAAQLSVTATAIRNRLARLVASGLVEVQTEHGKRGRPRHTYQASPEAHRRLGQNYADLAVVLWEEMMHTVADPRLRRQIFTRITDRLAELYRSQMKDEPWEKRLEQLGSMLHDRGIEAEVASSHADGSMPFLRQHSCPYFELAEVDHAICALERKMFEKVLGRSLRLSQCRLDGDRSCDFEPKPLVPLGEPVPTNLVLVSSSEPLTKRRPRSARRAGQPPVRAELRTSDRVAPAANGNSASPLSPEVTNG